jgi:hypothetical protein
MQRNMKKNSQTGFVKKSEKVTITSHEGRLSLSLWRQQLRPKKKLAIQR